MRAGAEAHYRDAAYYEHAYRRRRHDVRFYAELAGARSGPILELGAGAGRVTLAMARAGADVVAIERIAEMRALFRRRLEREPARVRRRVELRAGDLRSVRLGRRFPLVVAPFNVFNHLYTRRDWERALATAREHLRPRGRLVFDVLLPDPVELARDPERAWRGRSVVHPADGRRYRYAESFEWDPATQVEMITMQFEDAADPRRFFVVPLAQRHVFPAELEALLAYNGFRVEAHWGDFDGGPIVDGCESQVVIARPRG